MNKNSSTDYNQEENETQQQQQESSENIISSIFLGPSTTESPVTTFTFEDNNSLPLSKEYKNIFENLNVVYVTAVVCNSACTSTSTTNSENNNISSSTNNRILTDQNVNLNETNDDTNNNNNNNVSNQINKQLLMFSEVGFLTNPDSNNKVKLITVNTKPNQVLVPGHNHVLTLTSPTISNKPMDMNSQQVQKLLLGKPKPVRFEGVFPFNWNFENTNKDNNIKTSESDNNNNNDNDKFLIPVQRESNGLTYTARATSFTPQDHNNMSLPLPSSSSKTYPIVTSSSTSLSSCQLVSYHDNKVICQRYDHTNSNMDRNNMDDDDTGHFQSVLQSTEFAIERNNYFQLHQLQEETMLRHSNNNHQVVDKNIISNNQKGQDLNDLPVDLTIGKKTRKRRTKNTTLPSSSSTPCSLNLIPSSINNNNNENTNKIVQKRRSRKSTNVIKVDNCSVSETTESNNNNNNNNDDIIPPNTSTHEEQNPIPLPQTKPKRKRRTKEEIALAKAQNVGVVKRQSNKRTLSTKTTTRAPEMSHLQAVDPNVSAINNVDANDPISLFLLAAENLDNATVETQEQQQEEEEGEEQEEDYDDDDNEPQINNLLLLAQAASSRLKPNNTNNGSKSWN